MSRYLKWRPNAGGSEPLFVTEYGRGCQDRGSLESCIQRAKDVAVPQSVHPTLLQDQHSNLSIIHGPICFIESNGLLVSLLC